MDCDRLVFDAFDERIRNKYEELGLKTLLEYSIQGEPNTLAFYYSIVTKKKALRLIRVDDLYQELNLLTMDMKYIIAVLFYLQPYINDPIKEKGTYHQNVYDRRYFMYVSIAYQVIYIYWDRIGDLLDIYFQTGLSDRNVYFVNVINNIPAEWKSSINYQWLAEVIDKDYKDLNEVRKQIVHYSNPEPNTLWKVIFAGVANDIKELEYIKCEKEKYPELFRKQLNVMFNGFEKALRFINELPDKER
jgi:hypothetical protein